VARRVQSYRGKDIRTMSKVELIDVIEHIAEYYEGRILGLHRSFVKTSPVERRIRKMFS